MIGVFAGAPLVARALESGTANGCRFSRRHFQIIEASGYAMLAIILAVATVLILRWRAV